MDPDQEFMRQAIASGEKGRINAPPNPWVGCVIVKDGRIVGTGYHEAAGKPHAEPVALKAAGAAARDATVYITLEPCCHQGKTPPCTNALIQAGIKRVVIALKDPDPRVNGEGIALLQQAGVSVEIGLLASEAARSLEPYLYHRQTGKAFCVAKAAISIDGRTAAEDGSSKWITTAEALEDAHKLRAESQAILIGVETALIDSPLLTVRTSHPPLKPPLRVVLDSKGKINLDNPLCTSDLAPTLILTSEKCPAQKIKDLESAGVEVAVIPLSADGRLIPHEILALLGERGILQVLVEGGASVLGNFMAADAVNRLVLYVGPRILGDRGKPLFKNYSFASITDAPTIKLVGSQVLGQTVRLTYEKLK